MLWTSTVTFPNNRCGNSGMIRFNNLPPKLPIHFSKAIYCHPWTLLKDQWSAMRYNVNRTHFDEYGIKFWWCEFFGTSLPFFVVSKIDVPYKAQFICDLLSFSSENLGSMLCGTAVSTTIFLLNVGRVCNSKKPQHYPELVRNADSAYILELLNQNFHFNQSEPKVIHMHCTVWEAKC